jgi:hypothetical protein
MFGRKTLNPASPRPCLSETLPLRYPASLRPTLPPPHAPPLPSTPTPGRTLVAVPFRGCGLAPQRLRWPACLPVVCVCQGGNSGAPVREDFVELFNRGADTVDLLGCVP